jgi:hypothetical protein
MVFTALHIVNNYGTAILGLGSRPVGWALVCPLRYRGFALLGLTSRDPA